MNILIVNYEYPPLGGGGGVAAAHLARELARRGHSIDYVTTHYRGFARSEVVAGVRIFREPVPGRRDLHTASIVSMLAYPIVAVRRALALRRERPPDIVHTHFAIPSGPAGYWLSRQMKLPNVLSVYGGDIYDPSKRYSPHRHPILKRVVKRVLDQASVIVPESRDLCERTQQIFSPRAPIERIPLGFVPAPFERRSRAALGLADDRVYAIAVSRLIPRKAHGDLLRALALAIGGTEAAKLDLLFVGDGPEEPMLKALAAELGLAPRVRFLGAVDDATKYQYLSAADFFALATLHEGFGIVYQEAMFCGLPIATTNVGGHTDFLTDGENALLTPPGDPAALARSLRAMAGSAELRRRLGAANRAAIESQSIGCVTDQYMEIFQRLIAAGRAQPARPSSTA